MSRLINNQIWNARSFTNLSVEDKLLFLYLETSPETNYYGVFLLPNDQVISARTGLTCEKIKNSLEELQKIGKILLVGDYLIIFDYFDKQKNNESEKTKKGLENFKKSLPLEVYQLWTKQETSPLDTPLIPPSSPLEENKVKEKKVKEIKNKENENETKNLETEVEKLIKLIKDHPYFPIICEKLKNKNLNDKEIDDEIKLSMSTKIGKQSTSPAFQYFSSWAENIKTRDKPKLTAPPEKNYTLEELING